MKKLINWVFPDIRIGRDYTHSYEYYSNMKLVWRGTKTIRLPKMNITGYND